MSDEIQLPSKITIKIDTANCDSELLEALKCLYIRDKKDLPFKLPRLVTWPSKERALGERAAVLIKNGYFDLIESFSKNSEIDENIRKGATTKEPKTSKVNKAKPKPRISF